MNSESFLKQLEDGVCAPPSDARAEQEAGAGFNTGYTRGHAQAKANARDVVRRADARIEDLKSLLENARHDYEHEIRELHRVIKNINTAAQGALVDLQHIADAECRCDTSVGIICEACSAHASARRLIRALKSAPRKPARPPGYQGQAEGPTTEAMQSKADVDHDSRAMAAGPVPTVRETLKSPVDIHGWRVEVGPDETEEIRVIDPEGTVRYAGKLLMAVFHFAMAMRELDTAESRIRFLQHEYDSTRGLWATDRPDLIHDLYAIADICHDVAGDFPPDPIGTLTLGTEQVEQLRQARKLSLKVPAFEEIMHQLEYPKMEEPKCQDQ